MKGALLGLVIGVFGMLTPYVSKLLIDDAYPAKSIGFMEALVMAVFVMALANSFMVAIQSYFSQTVTGRMGSATSLMFFNHLQHLSACFFDDHQAGEVLSRFGDVRAALGLVATVLQTVLSSGVYLVLVPPFLLLLNWKLAIIAVIVIPVTVGISTLSSRIVRHYYKQNAEANAELNAYQFEVLSHIRTLKAMALEPLVFSQVELQVHRALQTQLRAGHIEKTVNLLNSVIRAAGTALLSWYAWTLILHDQLTLGTYIAFTAYLGYLTGPLNQFASLFSTVQQAAVSLGRMFEYLDTVPEQDPVVAYSAARPIRQKIKGEVSFHSVWMHYSPDRPILQDVSFVARRGTVTAIVGASGAGKSSLLRLIPRLAEPARGSVFIDGRPTSHLTLPDLRRQVSVVWQDVGVMKGTIWDNLTIGLESVDRDDVDEVIATCQLEEMIAGLPCGYDTPLAEWGATLSGGQRQRLAIARAMIRDTPILLLDEATANIDLEAEDRLLNQLMARHADTTILFVTHRVTTTLRADQVVVMESGRVVAAGAPAAVREVCPLYQTLLGASSPSVQDQRRMRVVPTVL